MRILFATNHLHLPQRVGGSELTTDELCSQLRKRGVECAVISSLKTKDLIWLTNRVRAKVTGKSFVSDNTMGYKTYRGWHPVDGMKEVVEAFKPDVVVVQAGLPYLLAEQSIHLGIKTVVYIHDTDYSAYGGRYQPHELLSFISNSNYTAKAFKIEFNISSKVIPPLVVSERYKVETTRKKVVFIGPVIQKGVELAFKLAENNPTIPFLFVESWAIGIEDKASLLKRVKKAGNIEWLEQQSDMKKIYSQTKLLLMPSICNETWGRVVTESQVSGIPTLASNRGGIPESVGMGGVMLAPEDDFEQWNEALNKFWFDDGFYTQYAKQALDYSTRETIQVEVLMSEFISVLETE